MPIMLRITEADAPKRRIMEKPAANWQEVGEQRTAIIARHTE
jgi:hypothetical protein